jgi:hypothetical protein
MGRIHKAAMTAVREGLVHWFGCVAAGLVDCAEEGNV